MPKYKVTLRQDAWVNYETTIEALTAEEAATIAGRAWKQNDKSVQFDEVGLSQFDEVLCDPEEVEEIEDDEEDT